MNWYLPIRSTIITVMVLLMVLGLLAIIIYIITLKILSILKVQDVTYTWDNDLQCYPHLSCTVNVDNNIWKSKDLKLIKGYQNTIATRCVDLIARLVIAEDNSKIKTPETLTLEGTFNISPNTPTFGAVWTDNNSNTWIAFRGTDSKSLEEWKNDFNYRQNSFTQSRSLNVSVQKTFLIRDTEETVSVHGGFLDIYGLFKNQLLDQLKKLNPKKMIIVTGHSLGAGVSTLCALDLASIYPGNVVSYTFASPRVGNQQFCSLINQKLPLYRIVNTTDIIPTLPPSVCPNFKSKRLPYLYQHCGEQFSFTLNWKSIANNHETPVYIEGIKSISSEEKSTEEGDGGD